MKNVNTGTSCAGVVATGVAGFFIGIVLFIYGIINEVDPVLDPDEVFFLTLAVRATIIVWLGGWCWFHYSWRKQQVKPELAHRVASTLIGIGVTASFFAVVRFVVFYFQPA